jgi:aryl-alcohol dehydrogenase-like predicted oxidoreductase
LALAWVLAKGHDIIPIPGTKRRKYLEENAAAADIALSSAEMGELEAAVPQSEITGARASSTNLTFVDR